MIREKGSAARTRPRHSGLAVALAGLLVSACVPPPFELQRPEVVASAGVRAPSDAHARVVTPFSDERVRPRCRRDSGFSADMGNPALPPARAQIVCSREIGRWLAEDVASGLGHAAFTRVGAEATDPDVLVVRGSLLLTEIEPSWRPFRSIVESEYRVRIEIRSRAGLVARRDFHVKSRNSRFFAVHYEAVFLETHRRTVHAITAAVASLARGRDEGWTIESRPGGTPEPGETTRTSQQASDRFR